MERKGWGGLGCDAATKDNSEELRVGEKARGAVKEFMLWGGGGGV